MKNRKQTRHGFTIVELVIVIAVIAILASVLVPTFDDVISNAKDAAAKEAAKNAYISYVVVHPDQAGVLCIYQTDGRFVAVLNGGVTGVYGTEEEAKAALGLAADAQFSDTGDGKLYISGDVPVVPDDPFDFEGKKLSVLGDSISTYMGVSNSTVNTASNAVFYHAPDGSCTAFCSKGVNYDVHKSIYQADTWWQQVIDTLGMELCVNNAYSGGAILDRAGIAGAYKDRCVKLHVDENEKPDVIVVYLGTNDFAFHKDKVGNADFNNSDLIVDNGDGTFTYETPTTACQGYAIMLHRISVMYPDAQVFCMGLLPRRAEDYAGDSQNEPGGQPTEFNKSLAEIATRFGYKFVDLEHCGVTPEIDNFDYYVDDRRVHPGKFGMDMISAALISTIKGEQSLYSNITATYSGVTTNNTASAVEAGEPYQATLTIGAEYNSLSVVITMGGRDITAACYNNGVINIPAVNGDITITATASKEPASYRWEFSGNVNLGQTINVSFGYNTNTLTVLSGKIENGVIKQAHIEIGNEITLKHDREWVIEWKANADGNGTHWVGMLLSQKASSTDGGVYIFKSCNGNGLLAIGANNGSYQNYGVQRDQYADGITTGEHTYCLKNIVNNDGTNTIMLVVDGNNIGTMTTHYEGVTFKDENNNWASGKDFVFKYIGCADGNRYLDNCKLSYLEIHE